MAFCSAQPISIADNVSGQQGLGRRDGRKHILSIDAPAMTFCGKSLKDTIDVESSSWTTEETSFETRSSGSSDSGDVPDIIPSPNGSLENLKRRMTLSDQGHDHRPEASSGYASKSKLHVDVTPAQSDAPSKVHRLSRFKSKVTTNDLGNDQQSAETPLKSVTIASVNSACNNQNVGGIESTKSSMSDIIIKDKAGKGTDDNMAISPIRTKENTVIVDSNANTENESQKANNKKKPRTRGPAPSNTLVPLTQSQQNLATRKHQSPPASITTKATKAVVVSKLPSEIEVGDDSSKGFSSCCGSVGSRGTLSSVDDSRGAPPTTPKKRVKKKKTRSASKPTIVTPDKEISSPVLTKSMCDYILGDAENLNTLDGALLTREMFDYIMAGDDDNTVTSADLFDEPSLSSKNGEEGNNNGMIKLTEISVTRSFPSASDVSSGNGHPVAEERAELAGSSSSGKSAMILLDTVTKKLGVLDDKKLSSSSNNNIAYQEHTILSPPLLSSPPPSPKICPANKVNETVPTTPIPVISTVERLRESDLFIPPPPPTPPPKKVRRRSSYTNHHPTIHEDSVFEDTREVIPKPPPTPPPPRGNSNKNRRRTSPSHYNSRGDPAIYEAASLEELGLFVSPDDVRSIHYDNSTTKKQRKRKGSGRGAFMVKLLLLIMIGIALVWPTLSRSIPIALQRELSSKTGIRFYVNDMPPPQEKIRQPKNPLARAWKKIRSRKRDRNAAAARRR